MQKEHKLIKTFNDCNDYVLSFEFMHFNIGITNIVFVDTNIFIFQFVSIIRDNPASDIYGANLFNDRIRRLAERRVTIHQQPLTAGVAQFGTSFTSNGLFDLEL